MHAGATGHTASATKPRQLDICVSLGRTPTVIQPLAKWRFFFNLSVVTLLANRLSRHARLRVSAAAWYSKPRPTFADTLAAVRRQLWREQGFLTSRRACKPRKIRPALHDGIVHALCYAA
jgi:hypothetical protein